MSDEEPVEETNAGFKKEGDWEEVADFAEEVEEVMDEAADEEEVEKESVEKLGSWRPKKKEEESEVKEKTVDEAVVEETGLERESEGVRGDLKDASGKAAEAGKKAVKRENPEGELKGALEDIFGLLYAKIAKFFRRFEQLVYTGIVLRFNPYYLDTEDFSVDMKSKRKGGYEMDVNVSGKDARNRLKKEFGNDPE